MKKLLIITTIFLLCAFTAQAQDESSGSKRAWELGIGGSVYQFNRINSVIYTPTPTLNIVDIKLRHVTYAGNLYVARELTNVFTLDFQGTLGKIEDEWLTHAGLGLQWRLGHYFKSPYIDPFFRVGAGYMYKGYEIIYNGEKSGVKWDMENVNNKGNKDDEGLIPVSLGAGINMWLNDRFGIGMQGDYLYMTNPDVPNSLQGTVRLLFRFGGKSKKPQPVVTYVDRVVERVVDRPVERIVERVVDNSVNVSELISSIYFDFDGSTIKPSYMPVIREIAKIMQSDRSKRYLITGFADAMGTAYYNMRLSEQRAIAIMNALINEGVSQTMLKTRGAGLRIANMPANATESAREGDRKVYIEVITNMEYWEKL